MKKSVLLILVAMTGIILLVLLLTNKEQKQAITTQNIQEAEKLSGLSFTGKERDSMLKDLQSLKNDYHALREHEIPNSLSPSLVFNPLPYGFQPPVSKKEPLWDLPAEISLPDNDADIAFLPVYKLAVLIKSGQLTSQRLTKIYLDRLHQYGDTLKCVVSLTENLALHQAQRADSLLQEGIYLGPLHGIPYGVKDLLAVKGYKTTWGAMPYKNQEINVTATVVEKLEAQGAVLLAKLSMGALAMGDVWFDGTTRNPWDLEQGSSGSSAGSASATAAGLVGFALGTETYGSIVSPSTRCGVSGLRPTFGRVSRYGAMALSWSMDKIGPISRSAKDNAIILNAIQGKDSKDPATLKAGFSPDFSRDVTKLKVAYLKPYFEKSYREKQNDSLLLEKLVSLGVELNAVSFPEDIPVESMLIILDAEAAAAFDELTRSGKDDELVAQHRYAWPNIFRYSRFIPATEYIQANRLRTQLIEQIHTFMAKYDVVITPSFGGNQLLTTNLTGHPCVVMPNGFDEHGHPTSISLLGNLFDEAVISEFAAFIQDNSSWEEKHPKLFSY